MSWPPCATPRSMSADSPDTSTSPPPNATTAGHPTPPSTPSSPHDQLDRRRSAPFHDLAMPLGVSGDGLSDVGAVGVISSCSLGAVVALGTPPSPLVLVGAAGRP